MAKTVGIVGAGPAGLASIKACLEEGLKPTAFEKTSIVGGVWNYDEKSTDCTGAAVFKSLITNNSKELLYFSDFPFPPDWPAFLTQREYISYINSYADNFDLRQHIRLEHEVLQIVQAPDYDVTGRWRIRYKSGNTEDEQQFDHVMICTGMFSEAYSPTYPGQDEFGGMIIHSNHYRTPGQFVDKNVLVIGDSYSAGDVATELGFHSKQVYLSMKKGCYVFPKRGPGGLPFDAILATRWRYRMPEWLIRYGTKRFMEKDVNYEAYGLRSEHKLFQSEIIANDFILTQIIHGRVKIRPAIRRFFHRGVEFADGSRMDNLDAIVFGTGYRTKIPIISDDLVSDDFKTREIYKYILPVRLAHPSLVLVGIMGVFGATAPSYEMQARWATRLFSGNLTLPSLPKMLREIEGMRKVMLEINHKHTIKITPYFYNTDLAADIGCRPNLFRMLLSDPALAIHMMFAPAVPASFRLVGPNSWPGARDAVMNCWNNYLAGTQGRPIAKSAKSPNKYLFYLMGVIVFVPAALFYVRR